MDRQSTKEKPTGKLDSIRHSLGFRTILIGFLALLMLVPLFMAKEVVSDRTFYYRTAIASVAETWGKEQVIVGPVLVVPYTEHIISMDTETDEKGETRTVSRDIFNDKTMVMLPKELKVDAEIIEKHRKRGIYDALVYQSEVELSGHFDFTLLPSKSSKKNQMNWKDAWIAVGISDTKSIDETRPLRWGAGSNTPLKPGTLLPELLPSGFHASMKDLNTDLTLAKFSIKFSVNGSEGFSFSPTGETTTANFHSGWPHPSFTGDIPPTQTDVAANGFDATWQIPNIARNHPQTWLLGKEKHDLYALKSGVKLFSPVSLYAKIERAVKYGALFIGLTFLTFFIFEITQKTRFHVIQYGLIGLALSMFYIILLSLAEQIAFHMAYLYAATATVSVITLYTISILKSFGRVMLILFFLSGLYALLYLILQMEDYAMLAGAGTMMIVVMVLMFATRNLESDT
ncbi:cell envelope integrity protein CreD [Leucothrix arctica]|uniref:Cell envelope integrity protein CreD n=1 Tax=Leucothrix arctica TaxID=1481894 RepID=A0A317CBA7_9GAMM|nr:cell envelope integrity protein CreD [Leucothrix arctica]PWQ93640.1 cell envelope integrity protein CreD [Leucothrix arctica]